jgi:NAD(P)-dependent dehydrogenase (short-subunit alcohol dehydrogenase family)
VEGYEVFAGMRNPNGAREVWELESEFPGRLTMVELDVTDDRTLKEAAKAIEGPLDILVNNAGVLPNGQAKFEELHSDDLLKAFTINTLGPLKVTQTFLPHLKQAEMPKVCHMTTKLASIADNTSGGYYAYRMSKISLNMINRNLTHEFPEFIHALLHPGWVKTNMGGEHAPTDVVESAHGLFKVIANLTPEHSGRFFDFKGEEIPW